LSDAVPPPFVNPNITVIPFTQKCGLCKERLIEHEQRESVICAISAERFGVDNQWLEEFFLSAIIANDGKNVFQCGVRNQHRSNPVMDQPFRYFDRAMIAHRRNKNLAGADPTASVIRFVNPQER
jgi:hypothetical protein